MCFSRGYFLVISRKNATCMHIGQNLRKRLVPQVFFSVVFQDHPLMVRVIEGFLILKTIFYTSRLDFSFLFLVSFLSTSRLWFRILPIRTWFVNFTWQIFLSNFSDGLGIHTPRKHTYIGLQYETNRCMFFVNILWSFQFSI